MAIVEIVGVEPHELDYEALVEAHLDVPVTGDENDVYAVNLGGWALGRTSPVRTMEVWAPELASHWKYIDLSSVRRVPLTIHRSDVVAYHPIAAGLTCGFLAPLGIVGMPHEFEWLLQAVLENERRTPVATVRVKRQPVQSSFEPTLHPLLLTGLGRSGSTWAMRMLAGHPEIVVQRRFYDTRAIGYWMHMARTLSQPASPEQSMALMTSEAASVRPNPFHGPPITDDPATRLWLGRDYPQQLAAFCQRSLEQLYLHTARAQQQSQPRYFVEKSDPEVAWLIRDLYPDMREIFLVRDFRDLLTSILAYDAKRGFYGFGRRPEDSEADYVRRFHVWTIDLCSAWRRRADRAHLLRYEDLVLNPVETLQRTLEYLGLEATAWVARRMIEASHSDSAAWTPHRTSPSGPASIGRWRQELEPAVQDLCQELFADALREFGYESA